MYRILSVLVLVSAAFGAEDMSWDEIKEAKTFQAQDISDPQFADYVCAAEEIDEIIYGADQRFYVKATDTEISIYSANNAFEAAVVAYCEAFNLGKDIPQAFEVKGPVQTRN